MDGYFDFYNSFFHFPQDPDRPPLALRIFRDKTAFDAYLEEFGGENHGGFVFLRFSDPAKNELAGYLTGDEERDGMRLAHYGLVQFLRTFALDPPLWLQLGFAAYFERSVYLPETRQVIFVENFNWLAPLRSIMASYRAAGPFREREPNLGRILSLSREQAEAEPERAYAESWGLVTFLLKSPRQEYNRILWESLAALDYRASRTENEERIRARAFDWVDLPQLTADYGAFVEELRSLPELLEEGTRLYHGGDYENAERAFLRAREFQPDHPLAYYYLGLIRYLAGDYAAAADYYDRSLKQGGDPALCHYALGLTWYADGRPEAARPYLEQALLGDPQGAGARAKVLLDYLDSLE
jgi:tetratricopeptide (TPR) repeat protein